MGGHNDKRPGPHGPGRLFDALGHHMWRWGELNPRPVQLLPGFSGRSVLWIFSALVLVAHVSTNRLSRVSVHQPSATYG